MIYWLAHLLSLLLRVTFLLTYFWYTERSNSNQVPSPTHHRKLFNIIYLPLTWMHYTAYITDQGRSWPGVQESGPPSQLQVHFFKWPKSDEFFVVGGRGRGIGFHPITYFAWNISLEIQTRSQRGEMPVCLPSGPKHFCLSSYNNNVDVIRLRIKWYST